MYISTCNNEIKKSVSAIHHARAQQLERGVALLI
jgi:hypothetical protein